VNNRTSDTDTPDAVTLIKAALLFLRAFALYFARRAPALDEQDSVQFAMGVFDFNLWKHQSHPPGYPLFIFLVWIGDQGLGVGPELSLRFVSPIIP